MSTDRTFNGHKNWNHWNVSLWINSDEGLYRMAQRERTLNRCGIRAARAMLENMNDNGITKTPDGAPYSVSSIRAAMREM
jgi:hypothetical protein